MFRKLMYISIFPDDTISLNDFKCMLPGSETEITNAVLKDQPIEEAIKESEDNLARLEPEKKISQDIDVYKREPAAIRLVVWLSQVFPG